jgi:hypothetical protein
MVYIPLADQKPCESHHEAMLELYQGLWGQGNNPTRAPVILNGECEVPQLGSGAPINLGPRIQPPTPASVDTDAKPVVETTKFKFKYIQLPPGLTLPNIGDPQSSDPTNLLIRSCYDEIMDVIFRREKSVAILGSPGVGE